MSEPHGPNRIVSCLQIGIAIAYTLQYTFARTVSGLLT